MTNRFFDLTFERLASGSIRLKQSAFDEDSIIDMHPAQLRHVAEALGLVPPSYPADELTKRLAEQLCTILKELADECHRSHWLELTYAKLDAWCSALPNDIFPFDLWEETEKASGSGEEVRPVRQPASVSTDSAQKPINEPTKNTAAPPDAGQLSITLE